jgi:hypothetical protein
MNPFEKASSLAWLIVSLLIIAGSSTYSFGTWSRPGPAFLPLWCGIIMAAFAATIYIQATLKSRKKAQVKEKVSFLPPRWPKLVAVLIVLCAYTFLIESLGFLTVTFITMLALLKLVEQTKGGTALMEAVLATLISYAVFELWLKVPLPQGFWPMLFY